MSRGHIGRASRRYPTAKRRAARYGQTQRGRRANGLPPHLLPGVTGRDGGDNGTRLRLAIAGALIVLLAAIGMLVATTASTVAAVGGTVEAYRRVNADLPNAARITADTFQTTSIYDRNGTLLQEIPSEGDGFWRTFKPLSEISQDFIDATVAAEDATFWSHRGVEPVAIARGLFINLGGQGSSGASTITQQLVRSLHPEKIGAEVTYTRKFREMLAAVAIEREYSKRDILTMYVNQIFYGNRSFGVEAAARTYFNKSAKDLSLSEATLLAGIPQQPTYYNPSIYPENAKQRQEYVLDQMVKLRYITREEADAAYNEMPNFQPTREGDGTVLDHPHFVQYVKEYLAEKHPKQNFTQGGLKIYTTIDTTLQERAEQLVREQVQNQLVYVNARNAAAVVMVPYTGEILAMVGSVDFNNAAEEGQNNITTSLQQPGSAIKPIVYAAAFEQGWHPGTVVLDAPFRIETPGATDPVTGQPDPYYEPENYLRTFNGAVSVRTALANSLNIPAVKAVQYVGGPETIVDIAARMGIKHQPDQDPIENGLAIGLGARELRPLELTNAYATFANNGKYVPATPILKITDNADRVLYELDRKKSLEQAEQAIRAEHAFQVTSILTDSASRRLIFGANNLFEATQNKLRRPTAAKSGTTNDFKDIWTMGYTTDLAIGVWVGNTRNDPLSQPTDGITGAGPIWATLMEEMHNRPEFAKLLQGPDGQPLPIDFARPPGLVEAPVCDATGGRPTENFGNRRDLVLQGGPALRCDQLSPWARVDLTETMKTMREKGGNMVGGAMASIERYARAVRYVDGGFQLYIPPTPPGEEEEG